MSSERTAMYSPEDIFSLEITHPSRPAAKLNKKVFSTPACQTPKCPFGVLLCTAQRAFFPFGRTYSFQPVTKKFRTVFRPELRHSTHFRTTAYRVQRRTWNEAIPGQAKSLSRNFTVILIIQTPGSVQSLQITGMKQNVLFLQRASMQKLINGSMRNVSRSGEKGGPPAFGWWWKVDSSMLG